LAPRNSVGVVVPLHGTAEGKKVMVVARRLEVKGWLAVSRQGADGPFS
jgi:hypothetical protein